jgi:O-acetyl-ADP-ribose deacetylase (regulator of RNase III)
MPDLSLPQADGADRALNDPLSHLDIVVGDITRPDPAWCVDTLVNAANESLLGGGGVDGAIHRAAGPELLAFNRTLGGCPTGLAKRSPAFSLEKQGIQHILHTVGPVWPWEPEFSSGRSPRSWTVGAAPPEVEAEDAQHHAMAGYAMPGAPLGDHAKLGYTLEDTLLASCYVQCLRLAEKHASGGVAFPAISTGVYRFPKPRAARIALGHVFGHYAQRPAPRFPHRVVFVCYAEADAQVYREALANRAEWMTNRPRNG